MIYCLLLSNGNKVQHVLRNFPCNIKRGRASNEIITHFDLQLKWKNYFMWNLITNYMQHQFSIYDGFYVRVVTEGQISKKKYLTKGKNLDFIYWCVSDLMIRHHVKIGVDWTHKASIIYISYHYDMLWGSIISMKKSKKPVPNIEHLLLYLEKVQKK